LPNGMSRVGQSLLPLKTSTTRALNLSFKSVLRKTVPVASVETAFLQAFPERR
jgi:hypothetical protein